MSLQIFFEPLRENFFTDIKGGHALWRHADKYVTDFPEIENADIALFGVPEYRGATTDYNQTDGPDQIRLQLYKMKKSHENLKMVDLGNLMPGEKLEDTGQRLQEVVSQLLQSGVLPIILGGTQDLSYYQFLAYEDLNKKISLLNIDAFFDLNAKSTDGENRHHLFKIFSHQPDFLFNYIHIGYQTYYADQSIMHGLQKLYYTLLRLGAIRDDIKEIEPHVREADLLTFDASAIRVTEAPANAENLPFGLTGEEACQLCWYAGLSNLMTSAGFYEYYPNLDQHHRSAIVLATMIWYFIDGYYNRIQDLNFKSSSFNEYIVPLDNQPFNITFYKNTLNNKWWVEVPALMENKPGYKVIVPCSYNDYVLAGNGELPDRWLNTHAKLI